MSASTTTPNARITRYPEFWDFYLSQHKHPRTRKLHLFGVCLVLGILVAGILVSPWLLLAMPVVGYGPAWYAHFFVEKNRPATFTYPFWSLISDFKMAWWMVTGRL